MGNPGDGDPGDAACAYVAGRERGATQGEMIDACGAHRSGPLAAAWSALVESGNLVHTGAHRQYAGATERVYAVAAPPALSLPEPPGALERSVAEPRKFDPRQPRDKWGKWWGGDGSSGPSGMDGTGTGGGDSGGDGDSGEGGGGGKLTDAQYAEHTEMVEAKISDALKRGQATDAQFGIDPERGTWTAARAAEHKKIVNDLYRKAAGVPSEGRAVIAGGLGGAGKSTVLRGPANIDQGSYLTLNPDDVKEVMAKRGMIPKVAGLSPMESSALVHEESSHITSLLAKRAYAERKNVIWDITMASRGSVEKRIGEMRAAGYGKVNAVFVDIPVETSVTRALARHRRGLEKYRAGSGDGGRYVPPSIIRKNESGIASSKNRETFDDLRSQFDVWSLYDNSGSGPELISKK